MLALIAWRNVWRNRTRSLVVITAIVVGIWAVTFSVGFINSLSAGFIRNAIFHDYSHLQLHHPQFRQEPDVLLALPGSQDLAGGLGARPEVKALSSRLLVQAMVASSRTSAGVQVYGIDPAAEAHVTRLDSLLTAGSYFADKPRNAVLMSRKLADKLKVRLRSKVVLTFQDQNGDVVAGAFRIRGLFNSPSPRINEGVVYVRRQDLARLVGSDTLVHEIAVLLHHPAQAPGLARQLAGGQAGIQVRTWQQLAPELQLMQQQSTISMLILLVILMLALAFGIVNTMLMAVLERTHELGMLLAVGMNKRRVFSMVLVETVYLALVGGPLGCLLGFVTISWLGRTGVDLSAYGQGLKHFGYNTLLYPYVVPAEYLLMAGSVVLTALLAAVYPAYKAVSLRPVEALRT
jgi:ABC-type lipoprotein release transport system permease subunit